MSDRLIHKYTETVALLSRGEFAQSLDRKIAELIEAFEAMNADSGKATLEVKLEFKYELGRIDVAATAKIKLPETERFMKTPFWVHDGALSVQHPSQIDMFSGPRTIDRETSRSA
jgi:hypothetical protein